MDKGRSLEFFLKCVPPKATHQASLRIFKSKDGRQFVGRDKRGRKAADELLLMLMEHAPDKPFEGAVEVYVCWRYPWRKSEAKKNMVDGYRPCDKRPDIDNLAKSLFDAMTRACIFQDDSQIATLTFQKEWGDKPGIEVKIVSL